MINRGYVTKMGIKVLVNGETAIRYSQNSGVECLFEHPGFAWPRDDMGRTVTIPDDAGRP